jgi:hypothetical protein
MAHRRSNQQRNRWAVSLLEVTQRWLFRTRLGYEQTPATG